MGRKLSSGAELGTATVGIDYGSSSGTGTLSVVQTANFPSPNTWQIDLGIATQFYTQTTFKDADDTNDHYSIFRFRIVTWGYTVVNPVIFEYVDTSGQRNLQLRINASTRVIEMLAIGDGSVVTGPVLNIGQTYRIETRFEYLAGGSKGYLRIDDQDYGNGVVGDGATHNKVAQIIWGAIGTSATASVLQFDDIMINDSTDAGENTWFGDKIFYIAKAVGEAITPSGTNKRWKKNAGGSAGDANNYQEIDEIPPDDKSGNFLKKNNADVKYIDWYSPDTIANIGIKSDDVVTCVAVGGRMGGTGATSRQYRFNVTLDGTEGSLVASANQEANVDSTSGGFQMNASDQPCRAPMPVYPVGGIGANIINYAFGIEADDATTREIDAMAVWLELTVKAGIRKFAALQINQAVNRASTY